MHYFQSKLCINVQIKMQHYNFKGGLQLQLLASESCFIQVHKRHRLKLTQYKKSQ